MAANLYCVRLSAIKPGTTERQTIIMNAVPAETAKRAGDMAIKRACERDPRMLNADIRFLSARRTDDAFWNAKR